MKVIGQSKSAQRSSPGLAFTLIELLVVISIIAISFALVACGKTRKVRDESITPPAPPPLADLMSVYQQNGVLSNSPLPAGVPLTSSALTDSVDASIPRTEDEAPNDATEQLNAILGDYIDAYNRVPKDLDELVRLKLIPRIPDPPAGKKYKINQSTHQVVLVSR